MSVALSLAHMASHIDTSVRHMGLRLRDPFIAGASPFFANLDSGLVRHGLGFIDPLLTGFTWWMDWHSIGEGSTRKSPFWLRRFACF
jgi:hypothetical protein